MDERRQQLTEKIAASSQPYTCVPISKRIIQAGTPEAPTKRPDFKPTPKSFVKKGHGKYLFSFLTQCHELNAKY